MITLATRLNVEDQFDRLKPEDEQLQDRSAEVRPSPQLESLSEAYRDFSSEVAKNVTTEGIYDRIYDINSFFDKRPQIIQPSARDIEKFCLIISNYHQACAHVDLEDLAGLFVSECIKRCPDNEISVPTSHLDEGLSFIGRDNDGKQITICGNAGNHTGSFMKSGRIEVLGNAGWCSGEYLSGGELIIIGNAGHELGHGMDGGILRVYGTASGNIGVDAEKGNGEIYIEGKFDKSLISIYASGCKIFHRGKLVYDHGRII